MEPSGLFRKPVNPLQHRSCSHVHSHQAETTRTHSPPHTLCTKSQRVHMSSHRLCGDDENSRGRKCENLNGLETPKENRCRMGRVQDPQQTLSHWCETPKPTKRDVCLRRRLLACKSATDGKSSTYRTPSDCDGRHCAVTESPEVPLSDPMSYSTLKSDAMTGLHRKRRLVFSQVVTSTLEDQRTESSPSAQDEASGASPTQILSEPDLDESIISGLLPSETPESGRERDSFQTPVNRLAADLLESLSVLSTPSCMSLSRLEASEDSGFSSLRLEGSDDCADDGSFQEGEPSQDRQSLGRDQRRARLERQRRLSTLREGSQSEDDTKGQCLKKGRVLIPAQKEVFAETPPIRAMQRDLSLTPALQAVQALSCSFTLSQDLDQPAVPQLHLSQLIGRKMGLGKMDVLTELSLRNLHHILASILQLLSARDVHVCAQVSDSWRDIIQQDRKSNRRRKMYERELRLSVEVGEAARVVDAESRLALACRSALSSVQPQAKTPSTNTVTCTPPSNKHQQFLQVAKTLFSDECLRPCPRCERPARCHLVKAEGVCSWSECAFHFCTFCLRAYHGSAACSRFPTTHTRRQGRSQLLPGSAQSKRNVRRL